MKLKDLLYETRIFQNNFIKVDMVEDELKKIFKEDEVPKIEFDEDGMFITLDNFTYRHYNSIGGFDSFSLTDGGIVDEINNIKKYYIEFTKQEDPSKNKTEEKPPEETTETDEEIPSSD